MKAIHDRPVRYSAKRAGGAIAWVSALAVTSGLMVAAPLAPQRPTEAQVPPAPRSVPAGDTWELTSTWNPPGADVRDVLLVTGDNAPKGAIDDEGAALTNQAFIGYWQAEDGSKIATNPDPRLAAGFAKLTGNAADNGTRMSAMDSGHYAGSRDYLGNGPTLYVWSNDSYDFFKSATGHPAEFTDAMLGTRPGTKTVCRPGNWDNADRGSWVSVVAYPLNSRDATAFWVPNPRSADVMSVYDSDSGGPNDYPGYYKTARDASWPCGSSGNWDDGWGGGEVIQSTGEIFFSSRQSSSMTQTYRAMIFNPKTGAFASSGLLQPNDPSDAIFSGNDAKVVGDLMIDGNANGYVIVEGRAPAGSIWHDPYDPSTGGGQRAYIVRIVPTPNPAWDPADPTSMRYLHNAGWKYNIVQRVYSNPAAPSNSDVFRVFGKLGSHENTAANKLKGSDWYNGDLYANNNRYLYKIDPMSGRADTVPSSGNDLMEGFRGSNTSTPAIAPRDMASGQEALTISGVIFHDVNGNGLRDPGDDGMPGVQVVLYEDQDNDGIWQQRSDTGLHTTDAKGDYTFFLGQNSRYQVRVFSPVIGGKQAHQTAASYGWGNAGQGRNEVDAHCHDAPDGVRGNNEGDEITAIGDTNPPQPCAGAVPPPFTDPAPPPVTADMNDPSYQLDNRDGKKVPFYSTIIVNAPTRIPNADFGFNADDADARCSLDQSSMTVSPTGPIEAGQAYTITVTARDKAGAPCSTATHVTFATDPAGPHFSPTACKTNPATGQCSTRVTATSAGTYQLHALMPDPANNSKPADVRGNGDAAGASPQPRTWTFEPATCGQGDGSGWAISPHRLPAGQTAHGDLALFDQYGNPCTGVADRIKVGPSDPAGVSATSVHQTPGKPGHYQTDLKAAPAKTTTYHVPAAFDPDGKGAAVAKVFTDDVTFTVAEATPVVDANLSWYHAVAADGHLPVYVTEDYTVSVYVRDTADKPMAQVAVTLAATPAAAFTPGTCHTDNAGRCQVKMTTTASHKAGLYAITAVADGTTINPNTDRTRGGHDGSGGWQKSETDARGIRYQAPEPPSVKFWGGPGLGGARVTAAPDHQTVGSPVKVMIEAKDAYDNPVEDLVEADLTVTGSAVSPATNPALAPPPSSFDASRRATGQYSFNLTSQQAGEFRLTGSGRGHEIPDRPGVDNHPHVWFVPSAVCPQCSTLDVRPSPTSGPITAGASYAATVTAKDLGGRTIAGVPVSWEITPLPGTTPRYPAELSAATCSTGADGTCQITVSAKSAGDYSLHARVPNPLADGQPTDVGGGDDPTKGSPQKLTWAAGPVCVVTPATPCDSDAAFLTRLEVVLNGQVADGRQVDRVQLFAFDRYGNPVPNQAVVSTSTDPGLVAVGTPPRTGDGKNGTAAGQATLDYTSRTAWVDYYPDIRVGPVDVDPTSLKEPAGNPPRLYFVAGEVCRTAPAADVPEERRTRIEVTQDGAPADGQAQDMIAVYGFDCDGNAARSVQPGSEPSGPILLAGPIPPLGDDGRAVVGYVSSQIVSQGPVAVSLADGAGVQQPVLFFPVGSDQPKPFDPARVGRPSSSPALLSFTDPFGPEITITWPTPHLLTNADPITVRGTSRTGGDSVWVDDGHGQTCATTVLDDHSWSCDLTGVPEGVITITATATDAAGRSATDQVDFTVDRTGPGIVPDLNDPGHIGIETEPNADVVIQDNDGQTICTAKADETGHAVCVSESGHVPQPGDQILILATDEAGNQSNRPARIVVVKVSDPEVMLPDENKETITGHFFQPGERTHAVIDEGKIDLGWAIADDQGDVNFVWTVPTEDAFGEHSATVQGETSGHGSAAFRVSLAPPLPDSGAHVGAGLAAGGGLIAALGLGLTLVARRRLLGWTTP